MFVQQSNEKPLDNCKKHIQPRKTLKQLQAHAQTKELINSDYLEGLVCLVS